MLSNIWIFSFIFHFFTLVVPHMWLPQEKVLQYFSPFLFSFFFFRFSVLIFLSAVVLITKRDLNAKLKCSSGVASSSLSFFVCANGLTCAILQGKISGFEIKETFYLIFTRAFSVDPCRLSFIFHAGKSLSAVDFSQTKKKKEKREFT